MVFSKKKLQNTFKKQFTSQFIQDDEVNYRTFEDYKINKRDHWQASNINYINSNNNTIIRHLNNYYEYLFFKKHCDYEDEAEYRFIVYDPDNKYNYLDISGCLVGIILGHNFPITYLPIVESIESELEIIRDQVYIWDDGNVTLSR